MRRGLLLFGLFLLASGQTGRSSQTFNPVDLRVLVVDFEHPHDRFVRKLFGCPAAGPLTDDVCRPARGIVSYGDFMAARKRAAKLYDLTE